jgi:hypothetical protein
MNNALLVLNRLIMPRAGASPAWSGGKSPGDDNMRNPQPGRTPNINLTGRASSPAPGLSADRDVSAAENLAIAAKSAASREKSLDEALECTFPASDPIASMNFTR